MKSRWLKRLVIAFATMSLLVIGVWFLLPPGAQQNARAQNPPAKPPTCPDSPNIALLRRGDGGIADVRIIQIRKTKLYVPTGWLSYNFVDSAEKNGPSFTYARLEKFSPDIHQIECAGVVHKLNLRGATPEFGNSRDDFTFFGLQGDFAPKEVQGSGGRTQGFSVSVQAAVMTSGYEMNRPRISSVGNYWIKGNPDFFLLKGGPPEEELRAKYDAELRDLAIWLTEPPATRQNDRVFFASPNF